MKIFHYGNPTHALVQNLSGGAFLRCLPSSWNLSLRPHVAALLRNLLKNGTIVQDGNNIEAIRECHRQGWIYAVEDEKYEISYMFPSPLHAVYVSWKLEPTNEMPQLTTLFDLVINVISNFKPSQLQLPIRRVGSRSMDNLPEAQYQDEFYRSVFSVTSGNVCISPEFASATGAHVAGPIDVFIPKVK